MTAWNHDINAAPRDGTRILLAEKIANGLRELSAAMSERNMDMELPDGTIDPTVAAEAIDRLSAEIASLKDRLALLQASERVMTQTAREQQLRAEAAEARLAEAEAEKGDITHLLAEAVDDGAHLRAVIREAKTDKAKAVKAEREVCADLIESFTLGWPFTRADVAAAIRARGGSDALP